MCSVHKIQLIGSYCARTDAYAKLLQSCVKKLALQNCEIKVTYVQREDSEGILSAHGLFYGCLNNYCPGCNHKNRTGKTTYFLPALLIDNELVLHSCFPKEDLLEETLGAALKAI